MRVCYSILISWLRCFTQQTGSFSLYIFFSLMVSARIFRFISDVIYYYYYYYQIILSSSSRTVQRLRNKDTNLYILHMSVLVTGSGFGEYCPSWTHNFIWSHWCMQHLVASPFSKAMFTHTLPNSSL